MSIRKKILIGYGVTFTLMGVVLGWAVVNLVSLGRASNAILEENYRSIVAAENMVEALERQNNTVLLLLFSHGQDWEPRFRENETQFLRWFGRAQDNITIEGERALVAAIDARYTDFIIKSTGLASQIQYSGLSSEQAHDLYLAAIQPSFTAVQEACINLRTLNEQTMYEASMRADRVSRRAIWSTVIVALGALIIALGFSMILSNRIAQPLREFVQASQKIAGGDYKVQILSHASDEIGILAAEFNTMATQLAHYNELNIGQIITEKQKNETVLASIDDGLVVFDTDLSVTDINPAAKRMLGLKHSNRRSTNYRELISDKRLCELILKTAELRSQPTIDEDDRFVTVNQEGKAYHYFFSITVILNTEGHLTGIVLLLRDVTRLKEVEQLKNDFVMTASHELRTPLTSMGMSIDLLMEYATPKLDQTENELLQTAHEEVVRLKALVNDLLDLSKIEAGKIELEFERVSVSTLLQRVQAIFKNQVEERSLTLTVVEAADLPTVRVDSNKITWVLTNLVSNALRYVPPHGHISIAVEAIGSYVHFSVRDDGPGIPQEYQYKIFQKFVQIKGFDSGGTGLGLAICKEIVRAHSGSIWVDSAPGQGSTFTFTVPLA